MLADSEKAVDRIQRIIDGPLDPGSKLTMISMALDEFFDEQNEVVSRMLMGDFDDAGPVSSDN